MFRVLTCVTERHDLRLVALALIICAFSSFTAFALLARARGMSESQPIIWASVAGPVAGIGIWATHFVAMLSFLPGIAITYEPGLTVASIAIAIALGWCAFVLSLRSGPRRLVAGVVAGSAIAAMHYVGMSAIRVPGIVTLDRWYIAASILLGLGFGVAAFQLDGGATSLRSRLAASAAFVLAICAMHFTGMASFTLHPGTPGNVVGEVIARDWISISIAGLMMTIMAIAMMISVLDRKLVARSRLDSERLRVHVADLEHAKAELQSTAENLHAALNEAAAASQAKSQFLATMSHELRTPLNAIIGFSEMIQLQYFGPIGHPKYVDYIETITKSGQHLLALITDILDFSRLDANRMPLFEEWHDLNTTCLEIVGMMGANATANGLRLEHRLAPDLPRVFIDQKRIKQILINLVSNATKFTSPGGTVEIETFRIGDSAGFMIVDTGIGIAEENIAKAMERFGQVDTRLARRFEGAGLGLPLAKLLAEEHQALFELESEEGIGTLVRVTFPASRVQAAKAPHDPGEPFAAVSVSTGV